MKLVRILVFSAVIVSLPLVAVGDRCVKNYNLKFKGEGQFGYYITLVDSVPVIVFYPAVFVPPDQFPHVPDSLNVSHLGLSEVDWEIRVTFDTEDPFNQDKYAFHSGWFTIIGANGRDGLEGFYSNWTLDAASGDYILDWAFTGGGGRFADATGTGRTYGNADLATGQAEFEFSGTITVPK